MGETIAPIGGIELSRENVHEDSNYLSNNNSYSNIGSVHTNHCKKQQDEADSSAYHIYHVCQYDIV